MPDNKIYWKLMCDDERVDKCWETGNFRGTEQNKKEEEVIEIRLNLLFKDGSRWESKGYLPPTQEHIFEANEYLNSLK